MLIFLLWAALASDRVANGAAESNTKPAATQPANELLHPADPNAVKARPFDPTSAYELRQIEEWPVRVNKRLLSEKPELADRCLRVLDAQLFQIPRVAPVAAVEKLRKVTIWVELNDPLFPCMCYHGDLGWVSGHGLNPEKAKCVELANAKAFIEWTHEQPWMVLHELAHAYHDQFLPGGFDNDAVARAYQNAKDHDLYKNILRGNGHSETAYAMNNPMEYFSETTEAFFGTNDFYPFVRAELRLHDPVGYDMMMKMWGVTGDGMAPADEQDARDRQQWVK